MTTLLRAYTLYKHPVRYCHHKGFHLKPINCIERNHGISEENLPAILDHETNTMYYGHKACVRFFQEHTGIRDLWHHAKAFHQRHPDYRINKFLEHETDQ